MGAPLALKWSLHYYTRLPRRIVSVFEYIGYTSIEIYHNPEVDSILFKDDLYNNYPLIMFLANHSRVQHIICNSSL
jgi:hypothetical protein